MKVYENGIYREATEEEIADLYAEQPEHIHTTEERLEALESAMLAQILGGAVNV